MNASVDYMSWLSKRREANMLMNGDVRLKYLLHLLPNRILIRFRRFHGTVNRQTAENTYGECFVWYIQPRGYDIEVILHDEPKPKGDK